MSFSITDFAGLLIYEPKVHHDDRGYFFEAYNEQAFNSQQITARFVQDNQSCSAYGVIRGLHYQMDPNAQAKLVRVIVGRILDVAVDMRQGSRTFGRHFAIELSAENKKQLFIPPGFAHGFSVLSAGTEVMYKCDGFYNKESEAGIIYDDPHLAIDWQIPAGSQIVSGKDQALPSFENCKNNFVFNG